MAENQIKIKLAVDTTEAGKITLALDKETAAVDKLVTKEQQLAEISKLRSTIIDQTNAAYAKTEAALARLSEKATLQPNKLGFFTAAGTTSVNSLITAVDKYKIALDELSEKESSIKTRDLFGAKRKAREEELRALREAIQAIEKEEQDAIARAEERANRYLSRVIKQNNKTEVSRARGNLYGLPTISSEAFVPEKQLDSRRNIEARMYDVFAPSGFSKMSREADRILNERLTKEKAAEDRLAARAEKEAGALTRLNKLQKDYAAEQKSILNLVEGTNKHLDDSSGKVKKIVNDHSTWNRSLAAIIIDYRAINFAYNQILNAVYAIPKTFIQLESTTASLTATFGTVTAAHRELQFLTQESLRTGIAVGTLREQYANAAASFISAGQSVDTTRQIFQNMNVVATTLHLTGDQVKSTYLALSQIFNKGKVQAEEMTKQLGQVIPAVTNQQAKALGITVSELYDRMKKGAISADEAVLKLSQTLATQYGGEAFRKASEGLNAQLGKLQTAWTLYIETLGQSTEGIMKNTVSALTDIVNALTKFEKTTSINSGQLSNFASILGGLAAGAIAAAISSFFALTGVVGGFQAAILLATINLQKLYALLLANPGTALIAIFGAIATKLYLMADASEKAEDNLARIVRAAKVARGELAISSPEYIKDQLKDNVDFLAAQQAVVTAIEKQQNLVNKAKVAQRTDKPDLSKNKDYIKALEDRLYAEDRVQQITEEFAAKQEAVKKKGYELSTQELAQDKRMREENLRNRKEYAKLVDSQYAEEEENLKTRLEKGDKLAQEQLNILRQNKADALKKLQEQDAKKISSGLAKEFKEETLKLKLSAQEQKEIISGLLNDLEEDYTNNLVSIQSYYEQKRNLSEASYKVLIEEAKAEKELALAKGEGRKALEAELKLSKLKQAEDKEETKLILEKVNAYRALQDAMYEDIIAGDKVKGTSTLSMEEIQQNLMLKNINRFASYAATKGTDDETTANKAAQGLAISIRHEAAMQKMSEHQARINTYQEIYKQKEQSILAAKAAGLYTESTATDLLTQARSEYLDKTNSSVEAIKEIAALNKEDLQIQQQSLKALEIKNQLYLDMAARMKQNQSSAMEKVFGSGYGDITTAYSKVLQSKDDRNLALKPYDEDLEEAQAKATPDQKANNPYEALLDQQSKASQSYQDLAEARTNVDKQYTANTVGMYAGMFGSIAGMGADAFDQMTKDAVKMYGAQSKEAKRAFAMYKAMRIAEATMAGAQAVIAQLANPTPYVGIALAAVAAAMTAYQIAQISAQQMPQAHAGLDYVPENNQTYLLSKGERVLAPQQNKDLTNYLKDRNMGGNSQPTPTQNIRIVNSIDPNVFHEYLGSDEGERVIMNVVRRNREVA
jgi:tape measure domain-containing protein